AFPNLSSFEIIDITTKPTDSIIGAPWGGTGAEVLWQTPRTADSYLFDLNTNTIVKYVDNDTEVIVPASITVNGTDYPVKSIGDSAFYNNFGNNTNYNKITKVTIEEGITSIGKSAFSNC
ncbi:MAG: hypothetical protein RR424_11270, partial [Oscillospiraceae bacterium]